MRRKPLNPDAAQSEAVDYLLREFRALRTTAPPISAPAAATGIGRLDPTVTVAASNADPANYAAADFRCDATNDEDEVNGALAYVETLGGGLVQLTEGDFYFGAPLSPGLASSSRGIRGVGMGLTNIHSDAAPSLGTSMISGQGLDYVGHMSVLATHTNYNHCVEMGGICEYVYGELSTGDPGIATATFRIDGGTIRGCTVGVGNTGDGIYVRGTHVIVDGNWIKNVGTYGLGDAINCSASLSGAVIVVNNQIEDANRWAIFCGAGSPIVIGNNCEGLDIAFTSAATNARYGGNNAAYVDSGPSSVPMDNDVIVAADISPLTTKADIWTYSTVDTRLGVGSAGDRLTPDSGETTGLRWDTPASAELYLSSSAETTITTGSVPVKAAGTTVLETTPAAVGFTMPSNNRLTYGGTETKKFLVIVTFSASSAAAAKLLGFHLAEGGTVNAKTTIYRYVGTANEEGAGGIQGLFEMATDDYVEMWVSNETTPASTTNLTIEHMTMTATEVP